LHVSIIILQETFHIVLLGSECTCIWQRSPPHLTLNAFFKCNQHLVNRISEQAKQFLFSAKFY